MNYRVLSLFSGAGGLDLGFELEGFELQEAIEINPWAVTTLKKNRPNWKVLEGDVCEYQPDPFERPDVLLAGFPCQGFSLGGKRDQHDQRNQLYREVIRIAKTAQPRAIVIENVLNLRTMITPDTQKPFAEQIALELTQLGYQVHFDIFRVSQYGVPQTRRRFIFVAFLGQSPVGYHLPSLERETVIRPFLYDLGQDITLQLPNHQPKWGFDSAVHLETGAEFDPLEPAVPVRFSRTASDGFPVRSFEEPFPAVDTATVWGWAQGQVTAGRVVKDRQTEKFIRNPDSDVTLWRISASRLRTFTHREYARLQTFPDDWIFYGQNKRDIQQQIGNAVPVQFAQRIARNIRLALESTETRTTFVDQHTLQLSLF